MFKDRILILKQGWANKLLILILATSALCLLGPIKLFSDSEIPLTLQSLLVILIPVLIGWELGALSVLLYLIAGAIGIPVFVEYSSGLDKFMGATGGFLIAFLAGAVVAGFIAELKSFSSIIRAIMALLAGHAIILGLGLSWFWRIVPEEEKMQRIIHFFGPATLLKIALSLLIIQIILRVESRKKTAPMKG